MFYLADTHIALWALDNTAKLPKKAKMLMQDYSHTWYISQASVWEIAIKHAKYPDRFQLSARQFYNACLTLGMQGLPIRLDHIYRVELLPTVKEHSGPFDRMLLAQAKSEDMLFVTSDKKFATYDDPHVLLV